MLLWNIQQVWPYWFEDLQKQLVSQPETQKSSTALKPPTCNETDSGDSDTTVKEITTYWPDGGVRSLSEIFNLIIYVAQLHKDQQNTQCHPGRYTCYYGYSRNREQTWKRLCPGSCLHLFCQFELVNLWMSILKYIRVNSKADLWGC